uniref:Septin-type G domain-containing protein n=1 Tax=Cyprinodon variegatus TaxID=28743 RepID=A0A3Q2GN87_CYPVA
STNFKRETIDEGSAQRLADVVKEKSILLPSQIGCPPLYKIPLEEKQMEIEGCKSFSFGKKSSNCNRNIMVVGAAGAGKSTVINAMINYVLGVRWEDSFRLKLVDEGRPKSQLQSQTSEITVYKLYHQEGFRVNYSLTIVDTPGFGGTGGVDRDKEVTEQLRNLFSNEKGVGEIDAVCFVVQAALTELTSTQRYVFDSALSVFGKDVAENIRILVTFADEQQQPVLDAIKQSGVPCPKTKDGLPVHFKFDNSVLFAVNKSSVVRRMMGLNEDRTFEFWNMGTKSMASFFESIRHIRTIRLTMTNEVLEERKHLEDIVEDLQYQVKLGLAKLEKIRMTKEKLQEHEAEIRQNENFELHVKVTKHEKEDISQTGRYITNCMQCNVTCHYPCNIKDDADKKGCDAMGQDGYCTQCPGQCFWSVHSNQKFKWIYSEMIEKRTLNELKQKYEKACGQKLTLEELMRNLISDYECKQDDVVKLMSEAAKCLNRLKEIALNPNPLTTPEYIHMLMKGEEQEAKPGWKERLQSLEKMKEKAEIIAKVEKGEGLLALELSKLNTGTDDYYFSLHVDHLWLPTWCLQHLCSFFAPKPVP